MMIGRLVILQPGGLQLTPVKYQICYGHLGHAKKLDLVVRFLVGVIIGYCMIGRLPNVSVIIDMMYVELFR